MSTAGSSADALARFEALLATSAAEGEWVELVLAKYRGTEPDLHRLTIRPVQLRDQACLSFVYRHDRRDVTHNWPLADGLQEIHRLLGDSFSHAHLGTTRAQAHLALSRSKKTRAGAPGEAPPAPRYQATLKVQALAQAREAASPTHNRDKQRWVPLERPFLRALGVTTAEHTLVPAMSRKWKQINKFVEVFAGALNHSSLAEAARVRVADFGCGKGYLTFAIHDHLTRAGQVPEVLGVELRADLVTLCNGAARELGLSGLRFQEGDVGQCDAGPLDVMIALHACDTATDHAIHAGLRAGASIILCSPCCHKQVRPQLLAPHPLRPLLQHGIHLGQEAEMLTDGLRALWLEACGYTTQVFEFVALEHTSKNKMILAVKRPGATPATEALAQIQTLKDFYGIREHCLEQLLRADGLIGPAR
ncbi:MAG: SAM-dependent methyltransferase [Pseudomonadota bacterium]